MSHDYDFSQSFHDDAAVFFNLKEFAAVHDIDGVKVPCVVASSKYASVNAEGVYRRSRVLYAEASRLREPVPGMTVRLDGKLYVIEESSCIQGETARIVLGVYDG